MNQKVSYDKFNSQEAIVSSIASSVILRTAGVEKDNSALSSGVLRSKKSSKNIHVYINESLVIIDIFINVNHEKPIPDIACYLQEEIKKEVEKVTLFKVESINIHVTGIDFK